MILAVLLVSAIQQGQQPPPAGRPVPARTTVVKDSTAPDTSKNSNVGRRLPVTAALAASAFKDAKTRTLVEKARRTRLAQDSTLRNYDATTRQRMSVDLGIGKIGREHLFWRQESASRVQWQRDIGAWVDLTGARVGIPMAPKEVEVENLLSDMTRMSPIPYFPGSDALWVGGEGTARAEANERDIVNPLAIGSEAYYTFAMGDSVRFTLQDGTVISLREVEVRPRSPKWNLAVGSLWFDDNGQVVKAVYRLATPIDMWTAIAEDEPNNDVPAIVTGFLSPMRAQITGVAIEYSLHGRHWLPRMRSMEGNAQVLFARVPMKIDQRFEYASVNGPDTLARIDTTKLPQILPRQTPRYRDSVRVADSTRRVQMAAMSPEERRAAVAERARVRDSARVVIDSATKARQNSRNERLRAVADSLERGLPATGLTPGSRAAAECDSSGVRTAYIRRFETRMPVAVRMPCDLNKLVHSPDLPKSIYDPGEELFSTKDRDEMMGKALDMAAQAPISFGALPRPSYAWGFPMTRYNRVEGLSTGVQVDQELGGGLTVGGTLRFGFADKDPNIELTGARSNLTKTIRVTGYHHLVSASDWGNPLSFGSSFSALFFGRDEGFYYRATGAEMTWNRGVTSKFEWRLFAEDEKTATPNTQFAVFHRAADSIPSNIVANEALFLGGGFHFVHNHGIDPRGFRTFTDFRAEAAKGDSVYGRAAGELTMSEGTPFRTAVGLTLSAGSSVGFLPTQRRWYLGGTQTVRGQSPDLSQSGNAFWLTRLELGRDNPGHRSTIFGDLGWAGDRNRLAEVGRPMSGVGYGESMFDGILRLDIARGLYPRRQWRFDVYLEARF